MLKPKWYILSDIFCYFHLHSKQGVIDWTVPPKIHMLESQSLVPQNVTVFDKRAFNEVVKVK